MSSKKLRLLSGGAAQSLVRGLSANLRAETGWEIEGSFSAVGEMKAKLLSGTPADVVILTRALIDELAATAWVRANACADLGRVRTGIAARAGDALPRVSTGDELRAALLAADAVYFPDPTKATAGIHFAGVLERLGVSASLAPRLRPYPNGNTAMRELASSGAQRPLGCTQITEIKSTPGVVLVDPLPREFELATVYTAAICTQAAAPEIARRLLDMLSGPGSRGLRLESGFEL